MVDTHVRGAGGGSVAHLDDAAALKVAFSGIASAEIRASR
jgi:hypothetical protein